MWACNILPFSQCEKLQKYSLSFVGECFKFDCNATMFDTCPNVGKADMRLVNKVSKVKT